MDPATVRDALRGQGLCGDVSAQPGPDGMPQACLFPGGHAGRHGWEPDEGGAVNQALLAMAVQASTALEQVLPFLRGYSTELDERVPGEAPPEDAEQSVRDTYAEAKVRALALEQVLLEAESVVAIGHSVLQEHLGPVPEPEPLVTREERERRRTAQIEERRRIREESKRHGQPS